MKFTNDLGSDNIKGLVWTLAVPSMLSQLVSVLYSIVDRMYIGNIPSNGTQALAGVGVCGPIVTLISSFAFLVGIGGAPLVSINLGEKNIDAAKKVIANCFVYILALAVPVTVLAYIFRRPILLTFGATEAVYPYAETYFSLYLIGTVFALTATGMNQFIITQGHSRSGMFSVLIGAIINIVLDPIRDGNSSLNVRRKTIERRCYSIELICQRSKSRRQLLNLTGELSHIHVVEGVCQLR